MSKFGLLGTAHHREPWERFLHESQIETVAIDRAPLQSLHELEVVIVVDTDFRSSVLQKIWLFEAHMDPTAPIFANLVASNAAHLAALCTKHPERVLGFACCPPLGKYAIEISRTELTSETTFQAGLNYLEQMHLPIHLVADRAGGIFSRTLAMLINEACVMLQEGIADSDSIDCAIRHESDLPHGALDWGEAIGSAYLLDVLQGIFDETGDSRYRPSAYLKRCVDLNISLKH